MTEEFEIRPNLRLRRVEEMPDRTAVRPTQTFDELSIVKTHTEKNVENTILCQSVELRRSMIHLSQGAFPLRYSTRPAQFSHDQDPKRTSEPRT